MSQLNPFAAAILPTTTIERQQAADRTQQIRRGQEAQKDSGSRGDSFEHQVESADAVTPIHDEDPRRPPRKKNGRRPHDESKSETGDDSPHLDLTA